MGAIFPMAPLAVRLGFVRRREKETRRAAKAQLECSAPKTKPTQDSLDPPTKVSGLAVFIARRSREVRRKKEARRLKEDIAVNAAVKDLLKAVRESVALIERLPRDDKGWLRAYDVADDGVEFEHFEKPSRAFRQFTFEEVRALAVVTRKHRATAKRLSTSIASARGAWDAALAEYEKMEGRAP